MSTYILSLGFSDFTSVFFFTDLAHTLAIIQASQLFNWPLTLYPKWFRFCQSKVSSKCLNLSFLSLMVTVALALASSGWTSIKALVSYVVHTCSCLVMTIQKYKLSQLHCTLNRLPLSRVTSHILALKVKSYPPLLILGKLNTLLLNSGT